MTKYWVEKESGVYDAGPILKRLARQGIVRVIADYNPPRYEINRNNAFVKELARFLAGGRISLLSLIERPFHASESGTLLRGSECGKKINRGLVIASGHLWGPWSSLAMMGGLGPTARARRVGPPRSRVQIPAAPPTVLDNQASKPN